MDGKNLHVRCMTHILKSNCARWFEGNWSFYQMSKTNDKFEKAFERFDLYYDNLNSYHSTDVCEDGSVAGSIHSDDWVNVRNAIKFLERLYELTLKVLGYGMSLVMFILRIYVNLMLI
ncbi:hypothetical protein P3L10_019010 [Capsicum annuum]